MVTGKPGGFWATITPMDPTAMANMATANMGMEAMEATDPTVVTMMRTRNVPQACDCFPYSEGFVSCEPLAVIESGLE